MFPQREFDETNSLICIKDFKDEGSQLATFTHERKTEADILREMNLDAIAANDLASHCNPESLLSPNLQDALNHDDIEKLPDKFFGLQTLVSRKDSVLKHSKSVSRKKTSMVRSKYNEMDCALVKKHSETKCKCPEDAIQPTELLIHTRISFQHSIRRYKNVHFDFHCLGSQFLHELVDKITCPIDNQSISHPSEVDKKCMKDICKSSALYIEDTFYTDFRGVDRFDIGGMLCEWAKDAETDLPRDMKQKSMNDIKFEDLTIKLGKPYIYWHQGGCEHEISFVDVRLWDSSDSPSRSSYPHTVSRPKIKATACKACHGHVAEWITRNDELSDEDPSFFCERCFKGIHYDTDGNKVGEFDAQPFINLVKLRA